MNLNIPRNFRRLMSVGKYKEILKIGVPIMLGQACVIVLAFADNIMIGWHSVDELAASSFVNNIMNLFILVQLGFASGLTPVIGAQNGTGNRKGIGNTLKNGLVLNLLIGIVGLAVLGILYFFLADFGQPAHLLPLIRPYFIIVGLSTFFAALFNVLKQFTDGVCAPVVSMCFLMGGNILNILGNWILIYGNCGFPELGLSGAGISTLLARICMVVAFGLYIFRSRRFSGYISWVRKSLLSRVKMKHFFSLGYPLALQMGMETSTFTFNSIMIGWLGATALAAHQVTLTISQLFFMMMQGLSFAISILVSGAYGRKDYVGLREYARKGYFLILCISVTLSVLIYLFRYQVAGFFTSSEEVTSIAVSLLFVLFTYQFGDGLQLCFANVLRGMQDVKPIMNAAFISYYIIAIPVSYLLGFKAGMGVVGVWAGFPVGLTAAGLFFYFRYRKDIRRLEI